MVITQQRSSVWLIILLLITLIFSVVSLMVTLNMRNEFRSGYQFVQSAPPSSGNVPSGTVGLVVTSPTSSDRGAP